MGVSTKIASTLHLETIASIAYNSGFIFSDILIELVRVFS